MNLRRWIALALTALMLLSLLPTALAVDNGDSKSTGSCPSEDAKYRNDGHHLYYAEVSEPSCVESGTVWWNCIYCGGTYTETLPALGHNWSEVDPFEYPTCTTAGMGVRFCRRCGIDEEVPIPALGHNWGEWQTITQATCTSDGLQVRSCSRCGIRETRSIPALGHVWGDWKVEYPGTCIQQGMNVRKCSRCGKEEYIYSGYGDHDWGDWFVVIPAGPGSMGLERRVCKIESSHVEERDIPALPEEEKQPALTLTFLYDEDEYDAPYPTGQDAFDPERGVWARHTLANTGDTALAVVMHRIVDGVEEYDDFLEYFDPADSGSFCTGCLPLADSIEPGTESAELLGVVTLSFCYVGYDPADFAYVEGDSGDLIASGTELCRTQTVTRVWKVLRAADGAYILKGVSKSYAGVAESGGAYFPDEGTADYMYAWADKGGKIDPAASRFYVDSSCSTPLAEAPKKGETYYFCMRLNNGFGTDDHSINFDQIDPDLVYAAIPGFDVTYLRNSPGTDAGGDRVFLYFSATCNQYDGPALTLTWLGDSDENYVPYATDEHEYDDGVWADYALENTGTVDLLPELRLEYANGVAASSATFVLTPSEIYYDGNGNKPIGDCITPNTDTSELLGTVTLAIWYDGLNPDTGEKLCESNRIIREWKILKDESDLKPAISVSIWADPGAGDGKRYDGAEVVYHYDVTNVGDCPVYVPWWPDLMANAFATSAPGGRIEETGMGWGYGVALLNPGESYTQMQSHEVDAAEADDGYCLISCWDTAWYYDAGGQIDSIDADSNDLKIDLTYPAPPEPVQPALTIKWTYDEVYPYWGDGDEATSYATTADQLYDAGAHVDAYFDVINDGNVQLIVKTYCSYGCGWTSEADWPGGYALGSLLPAESAWDSWCNGETLGDSLTANSETSELMGTVDITIWAKGFDPLTGAELCTTNAITRSWPVRKGPPPWEFQESNLQVWIVRGGNDQQAYPEGHQLGEWWDTAIYVSNTGEADIDEYTLHVDVTASDCVSFNWGPDATDGATWYEEGFGFIAAADTDDLWDWGPCGEVVTGDVSRGSIILSAYVTWIDPDSGNNRTAYSNTLILPVISRTGLLLQKSYKDPANGHYFEIDEIIDWELTVKNTSNEPIRNVVVTDKGTVVGTFAELAPGQKETCTVPNYKVTAYDAEVVTFVTNQAFADGDDLQGHTHTYPSNIVNAPCNKIVIPPPPPKKEKEDPPEEPKIDPGEGETCKLTLTSLSAGEANYTLHACAEHLAAAQAAEAAVSGDRSNGWEKAAEIWREEIDKLYQALYDAANDDAKAAVQADQEAFWACIDAYEAVNGGTASVQKAIAETLRLRCAELCCMRHTAPDALPDSILSDYASIANSRAAEATSRTFGKLDGSDCHVTVRLDAELTETMGNALSIVRGAKGEYAAKAYVTAQSQWQMALDATVNATYKAADRDARKLISAWRKALDQVIQARRELLKALYGDHDEIIEEVIANLYRDAAIDAHIQK